MTEHAPPSAPCPCCPAPPPAGISRRDALRLGAGAATALTAASMPFVLGSERAGAQLDETLLARARIRRWPVPPIVTRAQWGADESLRKPGRSYMDRIDKLIVHHTVTPNNPPDPAAIVRSIYAYHTSGVYIDIAYNWLIDHRGRIYQGRFAARDDRVGERDGLQVMGGHTLHFNYRTIGVAFLGTHTTVPPTDDAIDALVTLLAWKCARWGVNPRGSSLYTRSDGVTVRTPNIMGHRDAVPTTCPGDPLYAKLPAIRRRVQATLDAGAGGGYLIADASGRVFARGQADFGDPHRDGVRGDFVGAVSHPSGDGYWLAGRLGGVFAYGAARWRGSMYGKPLSAPIVDIARTPSGDGYWLLGADGGVFSFGDAHFHGSTGGMVLDAPVVSMARTPSGGGYWLLGRDGGVFSFGNARFHGSTGGMRLNAPVVDILPTRTGDGYALLAGDGGVFTFGDARYRGSAYGRTSSAIAITGRYRGG